ncbi:MAG: hypothetical protein QM817_30200 [Archangium sp.]
MPYEVSSLHLHAFIEAAKKVGAWEGAQPHLDLRVRMQLVDLQSKRWLPGALLQAVSAAIVKGSGDDVLDRLNYVMTRESLSRVLLPVVRIALTLSGSSPATIFSRMQDLSRVATRGVTTSWEANGENRGIVKVTYPEPPAHTVHIGWRGVFRFAFELTGKIGTLTHANYEGSSVYMHVSWQ